LNSGISSRFELQESAITKSHTRKKQENDQHGVKNRILDAATQLFANRGFLGVSVREIMSLADANVASAHYYFGSKEMLHEACVLRFFSKVDDDRCAWLKQVRTGKGFSTGERLRECLKAYVVPHYCLLESEHGSNYVRMIAKFMAEPPDIMRALLQKHFGSTRLNFINVLRETLPDVNEDDLLRAFSFFVSYMLTAPSDIGHEMLSGDSLKPDGVERLTERVVTFGVGGFQEIAKST